MKRFLIEVLRFIGCAAFFAALGAGWVLPEWVHTLDDGPLRRLRPSEVATRGAGSYRVSLTGVALHQGYVKETQTWYVNGQKSGSFDSLLLPVLDEGAAPTDPVHVLFDATTEGEMNEFELLRENRRPVEGVVRDALWEGKVRQGVRDNFASMGVLLAPDVRIVSSRYRNRDHLWAWGATGAFFFLGLFVAESWRLARKKSAASESAA